MKSVSGKMLCKIVEKVGWKLNRVKGSHHIYTKENSSVILVIPVHGNRNYLYFLVKEYVRMRGFFINWWTS